MAKRCYGCMKLKEKSPVCEYCGYNENVPNYPHQLPIGTVLRDQYVVGKVLGQGGFGITYIGWDESLETAVAIKEYYPNSFVTRECTQSLKVGSVGDNAAELFRHNRDRFLKEARTLAKLNDVPGIVRVHNLFKENDTAYIIMEYVEGIDLKRYIRMQGRTLTTEEVFAVMRPVMEAMQVVHKADLVHRDISPDNIMIQKNGKAKLLDFGAVREVIDAEVNKELPQSTEAILKHGFAPLEQYRNRGSLGPWTDVYALCATIYYCLTGKVPNSAPERILGDDNVNWHQIPGLNEQQITVLEKGMAIVPEQRIRSMQILYNELFPEQQTAVTGLKNASVMSSVSQAPKATVSQPIQKTAPVTPVNYPTHTVPLEAEPKKAGSPLPSNQNLPSERKQPTPKQAVSNPPSPKTPEKAAHPKKSKLLPIAAVLALLVIGFFTIHRWSDPTCTESSICTICGKSSGTPLGHNWESATCIKPKICSICGTEEGTSLGHKWKAATCTTPKTCSVCKVKEGKPLEHDYADATCSKAKTCKICGATSGSPLSHNWLPATYNSPEICEYCKQTRGTVKGYHETLAGSLGPVTISVGGNNSRPWIFEEEVHNCVKFTMHFKITSVDYGSPYGTWTLYAKDLSDKWEKIGTIDVKDQEEAVKTFSFDTPISFSQLFIAAPPATGYYRYYKSMWFEDWYLQQ